MGMTVETGMFWVHDEDFQKTVCRQRQADISRTCRVDLSWRTTQTDAGDDATWRRLSAWLYPDR